MRKVLLLAISFIALACDAQTFQNPRLLPTPHAVNNILHGDLNGDGFDDVIYDDFGVTPATLHVLLGNGHGGFTPGSTITLPANTSDTCVINNFTGTSRLDIACIVQSVLYGGASATFSIVVFPGNGDGTFALPQTISSQYQQYGGLTLVNAGDLNGDGAADMVVEQNQSTPGWPVLSDGHGSWKIGNPQNYYGGAPIFTGDLNGDGKIDWVFPGPTVALGNGDGTFATAHSFNTLGFPTSGCAIGDLDGDAHADAACAYADTTNGDVNGHWSIRFFHGNSDGSFTYLPSSTINFGDGSHEFEDYGSCAPPRYITDLNGDGIPDLLGVSTDGLTAYYGKGAYAFGPPLHYAAGNLGNGFSTGSLNWRLTDINGDHLPDIVSGSFNGLLLTLANTGSTFTTGSAYEVNGIIGYVAVADFTGDGIPDIVSTGDFHMAISVGRGDGTFLPYKNLDTGAVHWEGLYDHPDDNLLIHGDFNGDGKEDLVAVGSDVSGSFSENSYYLQGKGDGTFQPPISMGAAPGLSYLYGLSVVADFNGDHFDDIIGKPDTTTGQIYATMSQGNGTFTSKVSTVPQEPTGYGNGFNYAEPFPGVADFDGDGKPDIVVASRNNAYFLHGNGDGTFSNPVSIPIPPRPNAGASEGAVAVQAGDFDGDGHKDFAVLWGQVTYGVYINGPAAFGEIVIYYGKGDGTFAAPVIAAYTTADYVHLGAADLGHDGRDQIVAYSSGTLNGGTDVGVLRGAADRTFASVTPLAAGSGLANLQIADLNHDGYPDLVFSNEDYNIPSNSATVLMNLRSKPAVTASVVAAPEPSNVGDGFTLTASFVTPDASLVSGTVTFSIDGTAVGSANLANNSASLSVAGNYAVGAHSLSASWPGNTTFDPVTPTGTHNVIAIPTTVALTSSVNPSIVNQPVTFTALVTSANGQTLDGAVVFSAGGVALNAQVVVNTSPAGTLSASITTSALPVGSTLITASYVPGQSGGNSTFAASLATLTQQVLTGYPSTTTLTSSLNPSFVSQPVTFSAHVAAQNSTNGTPSGSVTFTDGSTTLGAQPVDSSGNAALTTSALNVGTHSITAAFVPSNSFSSSSASLTQTVTATVTTATLTVSPSTSSFGTPLTLTASVSTPVASPSAITGTVTFCNAVILLGQTICSGTVLGTVPLNTAGIATLQPPVQPVGSYTFGCIYNGDLVHASAACNGFPVTVSALPTALTLTSSANPSTALTPITFTATLTASGKPVSSQSIAITIDGKPLPSVLTNNSGVASLISTLSAGSHIITATYANGANYTGSSALLTETVTPNPTITTLSASPNPVYEKQPLTLAATIHALSGTATPDGSVTFYDGSLVIGTVALPAFAYTGTTSTASLTTSTLAPGDHAITAVYTPVLVPSNNFIASTSAALTVTVLPQTYVLTISDSTLTIQTEHHKTTTVTLTSIGGFTGPVSLACGALPDYATCIWGQTTLLLPANGSVSTQLNIDTDVVFNYASSSRPAFDPWRTGGTVALAIFAPLILFRRKRLAALLPLALLIVLGVAIGGCSGKYPGHTAPGTYGIAINASGTTAGATGSTAHSTQLRLIVSP